MPQIQVFLADGNQLSQDLGDEKITIGRLADNSLQIDDGSVSSHHAELTLDDGIYRLHDLGSTNGTFVNDEQVTDATLKPGDEVRFGRVSALFTAAEESGSSQPLPESSGLVAEVAKQSARPANFVSTSPTPRGKKGKDVVGMGLYVVAGLAFVAIAAAAYFVAAMDVTY